MSTLLFVIGFMGVGKSTIGRRLAQHLGYRFLDLDELIVSRNGQSIAQLFANFGEPHFRKLETEALASLAELPATSRFVVALGGGAFVSDENRNLVATMGRSLWLNCNFEELYQRISGDARRPLAKSLPQLTALYQSRVPCYQLADIQVDISGMNIKQATSAILNLLRVNNKHRSSRPPTRRYIKQR